MRPPCYNRPPRAAGTWESTGRASIRLATPGVQSGVKEHLRWRPSPFEDRCATHDGRGIGPKGESYPEAHGWQCAGCRWEPERLRRAREFDDRMRHGSDAFAYMVASTPSGRSPSFFERALRDFKADGEGFAVRVLTELPADWGIDLGTELPDPRRERTRRIRDRLARDAQAVDKPAHNPRVIPSFEPGLPAGEPVPTHQAETP